MSVATCLRRMRPAYPRHQFELWLPLKRRSLIRFRTGMKFHGSEDLILSVSNEGEGVCCPGDGWKGDVC
ncbi:hypothetical protein H6P81_021079 [Aristolochia fimbriata]|uniref:Uncharacterized protein n=1 Tax=Aristolochia fimbriata TaxID=158543 RepID=A0AAV7DWL4_ARIFI|nr:hypothetical protein H6P81_021079 [Aristolochia fimbriata]